MAVAHLIYWLYEQYDPVCAVSLKKTKLSEYFLGARETKKEKQKREGFWGELPGRDYHEGSYDDPTNADGALGHEKPTGDFMSREEANKSIYNVLMGTKNLPSTENPNEGTAPRTADQIFTFHDEMEGVRASISGRKRGRVWTPSEFLNRIERDGYKTDDPLTGDWDKSKLYPANPYDTSNVYIPY